MGIRDIPLEDRPEIGRKLYEARKAPMTWPEACRLHYDLGDYPGLEPVAEATMLAKLYANAKGLPWPVKVPPHWTLPSWESRKAALREAHAARTLALNISHARHARQERMNVGLSVEALAHIAGVDPALIVEQETNGSANVRSYRRVWDAIHSEGARQAMVRRRGKPIRDWLILTDGPARFASELPAPA